MLCLLCWHSKINFIIIVQCFVDIHKTWRNFYSFVDRETHSHSFTWLDIWILSQNDYSNVFKSCALISVKDLVSRRKTWITWSCILFLHIIVECSKLGRTSRIFHDFFPITKLLNKIVNRVQARVVICRICGFFITRLVGI